MPSSLYFDLETCGLLMEHPVIQFAAIAVNDQWKELEAIELKILFDESKADPEALKINHYDPAVWKVKGVHENEAVYRIGNFIDRHKSLELISKRTGRPYSVAKCFAHNAQFDQPRLKKMFDDRSKFLPIDLRVRCTVQRALWWFEDHPGETKPIDYQLQTLCRYFGVPVPDGEAHDALVDVRLNIQLARAMAKA